MGGDFARRRARLTGSRDHKGKCLECRMCLMCSWNSTFSHVPAVRQEGAGAPRGDQNDRTRLLRDLGTMVWSLDFMENKKETVELF